MELVTKVCKTCALELPLERFAVSGDRSKKIYRRRVCKSCYNLNSYSRYQKQYIQGLSEEQKKIRRIRNTEYQRKYLSNTKNRNKKNETARKHLSNPIFIERRRERQRKNNVNRRKTDINFRITGVLRSRLRKALVHGTKSKTTLELLGCSLDCLREHLEAQFQPGMSWENYGRRGWHIDHIKPISKFDLTDPAQLSEVNNYTNLQPLWWQDNLAKYNKFQL